MAGRVEDARDRREQGILRRWEQLWSKGLSCTPNNTGAAPPAHFLLTQRRRENREGRLPPSGARNTPHPPPGGRAFREAPPLPGGPCSSQVRGALFPRLPASRPGRAGRSRNPGGAEWLGPGSGLGGGGSRWSVLRGAQLLPESRRRSRADRPVQPHFPGNLGFQAAGQALARRGSRAALGAALGRRAAGTQLLPVT